MKLIAQGAEAKILLSNDFIIKDRIKKSYRIPELDKKIRKRRTKSEAKLLQKASKIIFSPAPLTNDACEHEKTQIRMPFIKGKKLSEHLDKFSLAKQKQICKQIGESIAKLHEHDIIHGDLTTSNMILIKANKKNNFEKLLMNLKKLDLPLKEYVVFGSAPLAIRGLRDSRDLDLLVSKKIFNNYKKKSGWKIIKFNRDGRQVKMLEKNNIEFYFEWGPGKWNTKEIINNSEIIKGVPFANLNDFIKWKKISRREKDKRDIELIKNYLSLNKSSTKKSDEADFDAINLQTKGEPIIFFIDFGLGFISRKIEDKAVDLHLLKQALEAKHFKHWKELYKEVEKGYKNYNDSEKVFNRLIKVEKRGRYKH